jgi:1-acyl-sn-glycerol-3-phosphate acyltransferase
MLYHFAQLLIKIFVRLIARVEVSGLENVPKEGALIAASNHLGRLDAVMPYIVLDRTDITMMVAEKYKEVALFRWFAKALNAIWVDRYNADLVAMRESLSRLKKGTILVMAPEGTRSPTGALIEARPGASYLAARSGFPVLPVAVTGTEDKYVVVELKHLRRVKVVGRIGKPFTLPPLKPGDREAELKRDTDEIMCRIAAMLPPEYRGVYADHPRTLELINGK